MEFVHAHGEGFTVTKYVPVQDGSIRVSLGANIDNPNPELSGELVEIEVVVNPSTDDSLQQIEKAARERARLILEAAAKALKQA
ncbi:hypothetical protein H6F88_00790 [Oculatella sp. FACHB-28]|uniref:hypothetical protein n=1 Tax=Oculatella sp. FACHB-28 TaxID=2692845 RepID=UPI001682E3E6|nr:hypothetical protein [Oculatella sp. FACHB-28]MBD2054579.1 hypothetical protein [Oculatella sp. FACHB-28]